MNHPDDSAKDLATMMPPGVQSSDVPQFHKIGEFRFQELCRDLLDAEPVISGCEIYGTRGQRQYGIDLLAHRMNGDGIDVGQCKCYERFSAKKIEKTSDEFLKRWNRWSRMQVKRFILFVACDLSNRDQQDEIIKQRKQFQKKNIIYEVWSAAKIRSKLRPHPGIVSTYLSPAGFWVSTICGTAPLPSPSYFGTSVKEYPATLAVVASQFEQLSEWSQGTVDLDLQQMRTAWREGRETEVWKWVKSIKSNHAVWSILAPSLRAKILHLQASLELDAKSDATAAKILADEAHELAPSENQARLRALIARKESNPEAAVRILDGQEDVDSINLRAVFLLEMGRINECITALNLPTFKPNAETFRVRALSYFLKKDLNQARLEIAKALELEPNWESVRFVGAIINYYSALSPTALPHNLPYWPEPVDWIFVKSDNENLVRLRDAEKVFEHLVSVFSQEKEERLAGRAWRLACLCNDPERQDVAIEYCRKLLRADSAYWPAIAWSSARNYDIDLKPSRDEIEKRIADGEATLPQILSLVASYLRPPGTNKALAVLEQTKLIFGKNRAEVLWTIWHVQAMVASGDPKTALATINDFGSAPELRGVRAMAMLGIAEQTKDSQLALTELEQSYSETADARFLIEACELMARQANWEYVAEKADRLVREVETGEALRLAAIGTFNSKHFDTCLGLLDQFGHLYKDRKLPSELRRMRVLSQYFQGILPPAIKDAEDLVQDEPSEQNLVNLAQLYFAKGDLRRLAIIGQRLLARPQLRPELSLHIARLVISEDRELATALWRKALSRRLPDSLVGEAMDLGFRLGLDHELGPLMARIAKLGNQGRGGIQVATLDQLLSRIQQQREAVAKANELYQSGDAPIHMIAEVIRLSLATVYHRLLVENEERFDPLRQPSVLVRHGGHSLIPGFPVSVPKWRLHLDITAILLGAHISILGAVESAFKPLHIPEHLPVALLQMGESLAPHQPSRLRAYQQILAFSEQGLLKAEDCKLPSDYQNTLLVDNLGADWVALYERARTDQGYVVSFLPLTHQGKDVPITSLPDDRPQYVINCRAIIDSLRNDGPMSESDYRSALNRLGREGQKSFSAVVPQQGSLLYCFANIPEVLANADLLRIVCERFHVCIQTSELRRIRMELQNQKATDDVIRWLSEIRDRISRGIDDGTYEVFLAPHRKPGELQEAASLNPDLRCLLSLFTFQPQVGDAIWVDDRFMSSYAHRDGIPIIGINEVLKALVTANALTESEYYDKLSSLRAANASFIPVQKDEILYYLRQSRVEDGQVIETRALEVLRRYVGACLVRGKMLQRPREDGPNKNGESEFFLSLNRAILDALLETWSDEQLDDITCVARARWVLDNLYVDLRAMFNVIEWPISKEDPQHLISLSMVGLVGLALTLKSSRKNPEASPRRKYLEWLDEQVLQKRFESEPSLVASVANLLKGILIHEREDARIAKHEQAYAYLLQQFYNDLPEPIRNELWHDTEFMSSIGIQPLLAVTVDGLNFKREDFFKAAAAAINGHVEKVTPLESTTEVVFQPYQDQYGRPGVSIQDPSTNEKKEITGLDVQHLTNSVADRERLLRENRYWFDCPKNTFDQIVAEISPLQDAVRRSQLLESWRKKSATVYYSKLNDQLRQEQSFRLDDLFPHDLDGLVRYLRIDSTVATVDKFEKALSQAAQTLVDEEGLVAAIDRLASLPVPLPAVIIEAVARLNEREGRTLIKKLIRTPGSPISRIHLVRILLCIADRLQASGRFARRIVKKLLNNDPAEGIEGFLAILRWTDNQFEFRANSRSYSPHLRITLTWGHSHRLFSIFASSGVALSWVSKTFGAAAKPLSPGMFRRDPALWFDVASPIRVNQTVFLLMGLAYGFGNTPTESLDDELGNLITDRAFQDKDDRRLPVWPLLNDSTGMSNALGSFLGGDRAEKLAPLVGLESAAAFSSSALHDLAGTLIRSLSEGGNEQVAWPILFATLGDLPPREDLAEQMKSVLLKCNLVELFGKNVELGSLALQIATLQVINLRDEQVRSHLREELGKIAKYMADQEEFSAVATMPKGKSTKQSEMTLLLLQSALNIALAGPNSSNVVLEFREMIVLLTEVWRGMIPVTKSAISRFCEELPFDQAQHFWSLNVRMRAQ